MKVCIAAVIFGLASFSLHTSTLSAQVVSDTLQQALPDRDFGIEPETDPEIDPVEIDSASLFRVYPVRMRPAPLYEMVENDSTLRWRHWLEWSDKLSRKAGTITYRQGGFNRTDYVLYNGLGLRSQQLYIEGMHTHNAVTGQAMYPHISLERLSRAYVYETGLTQRTEIELQRMYLRRPRTRVRYEQSSFDLRSTEVQLAQMATRQLGLEVMYHGKNHDGEYQRSQTESRQMSARAWYHISPRYVAQTMIQYNGIQLQESGGYSIANLSTFNFSRFFANPVFTGATSSVRQTQVQLALMRREGVIGDSSHTQLAESRLLLYYDRYRRSFSRTNEFTSYRYQGINAALQHHLRLPFLHARGEVRGSHYFLIPSQNPSVSINHWSLLHTEIRADLQPPVPFGNVALPLLLRSELRSDGVHEWEAGVGARISPISMLTLIAGYHIGMKAPTIQQRYWVGQLSGTADLPEAGEQRMQLGAIFQPGNGDLRLEAVGYLHKYDHLHVLRSDSTFGRIAAVDQWGARLTADWHHPSWEVHLSSTLQQYQSDNPSIEAQFLSGSGLRIWNRGSVHWKGYVLDRAAFIKTGVYGMFSPNAYRPAAYIVSADYWDGGQDVPEIPGFIRVDIDLTARVRTLMVLLRYENVTQGLMQQGYYESPVYPMPSRRLRFGLRVYFTN